MQTEAKFCFGFNQNNINFFSAAQKLPLITKVSPSLKLKKSFKIASMR